MLKKLIFFLCVRTLHRAAQARSVEKTRILLARGHDVNGRDKHGTTPLFWAAFCKDLDIARLLVEHGADVNAVGPQGATPLYNALHKGNEQLALWLLEQGADPRAVTEQGITMLHLAALHNKDKAVARLLELGADVNVLNANGQSPLCLAMLVLERMYAPLASAACVLRLLRAGAAFDPVPGLEGSLAERFGKIAAAGEGFRGELRDCPQRTDNPCLRKLLEEALTLAGPEPHPDSPDSSLEQDETPGEETEAGRSETQAGREFGGAGTSGTGLFGSSLHAGDDAALRAIRAAFSRPPDGWEEDTPTDAWPRLRFETIDGAKRVVELELVADGRLAPEIGDLTQLRKLSTWCADIEGPLPGSLGTLKHLRVLELSGLPRVGERLPDSITGLKSLEKLELRELPLTSLPDDIGGLKQLETLSVWNCPIPSLPDSLGEASRLDSLWLVDCPVTSLPDCLGDLPRLGIFMISGCELSEVPACIARMDKLFWLSLARNRIEGPIPDFIFKPNLHTLNLNGNAFSGPIPESVCHSPITSLLVGNNRLSGEIPACVASLQLHTVEYSGNDLVMSDAVARQTEKVTFYMEHPFLRYREEPGEDDSGCEGPEVRLYGVPEPFRLEDGYSGNEWRSKERRSAFWGELQRFYFELHLPDEMTVWKLGELLPDLLPLMDEAMRRAEAVPLAELHAGVADCIYDIMREEVDAGNEGREPDEQTWLPPRERLGEVFWPTGVTPVFTLHEDGSLTHAITVSFETYEHYLGDIWLHASITDGALTGVEQS